MRLTSLVAGLALPLLAVATPWGITTTSKEATTTVTVTATATSTAVSVSQCNTGAIQCCNSVQSSSSAGLAGLLGLLGVVLEGINVPIGVTCSPISVIGAGGNSCSAAPVCCENNSFNGLIAIGCVPISIGL